MSSGGVRLQMDMIEDWNGASACMLQAALRMSNEAFAAHLGISVRTVAGWHQNSAARPRTEMQQLLDTALSQASSAVRERFAALIGQPVQAPANAPASQPAGTGLAGVARRTPASSWKRGWRSFGSGKASTAATALI
jgi:hypothetical protein